MFKHILIPTDGSELALGAVRKGVELAKEAGAKITLVTVTRPFSAFEVGSVLPPPDPQEHEKRAKELAASRLSAAKGVVEAQGVPVDTVHSEHFRSHEAIIEAAASRGCDLILMSSNGWGGLASLLLGSVTNRVLTHSTIPVLVVR